MSKEKQCKCCKEYWWEMNIHTQSGLCPNCYDYVADLEAKLAESEKQRQHLKDWLDDEILTSVDHESYYVTINEYEEEIEQLKQQLAEKEAEIEEFKNRERKIFSLSLHTEFENKLKQADQDKISFAVEKLKETQIYVDNQHFMNARYKSEKKVYADIWNFIDNQIKLLKEK